MTREGIYLSNCTILKVAQKMKLSSKNRQNLVLVFWYFILAHHKLKEKLSKIEISQILFNRGHAWHAFLSLSCPSGRLSF